MSPWLQQLFGAPVQVVLLIFLSFQFEALRRAVVGLGRKHDDLSARVKKLELVKAAK